MRTLFIADLHLQKEQPEVITNFLHFLHSKALAADALYILGDLFETWIGDDDPNPLNQKIAIAIKSLVDCGTPCYFIHGNRDFLLGKKFAKESGIILLSEEQILNLYGHKILIMHGDILCTNDKQYQNFRARIHHPLVKKMFLSLPLFIRHFIAKKTRINSIASNCIKSLSIMDVNHNAVIEIMKKHRVQLLIYGHTHRPGIYKFVVNDHPALRISLSAWNNKGSMVKVTPNSIELIYFS